MDVWIGVWETRIASSSGRRMMPEVTRVRCENARYWLRVPKVGWLDGGGMLWQNSGEERTTKVVAMTDGGQEEGDRFQGKAGGVAGDGAAVDKREDGWATRRQQAAGRDWGLKWQSATVSPVVRTFRLAC